MLRFGPWSMHHDFAGQGMPLTGRKRHSSLQLPLTTSQVQVGSTSPGTPTHHTQSNKAESESLAARGAEERGLNRWSTCFFVRGILLGVDSWGLVSVIDRVE